MHACMLAYTYYEGDNRVRRYAETLVRRGDTVDAIVLRQSGAKKHEVFIGVNIYKIQHRNITEKHKLDYLIKLVIFFIKSLFYVTILNMKKHYDLIHVHSVPDFEVFATIIAKLTGSRIILDIHDIVPELFTSKFHSSKKSFLFNALLITERWSSRFADHVIIANHIWYQRITGRSVPPEKCTVVMNYPDDFIFNKKIVIKKAESHPFTLIYPGTLSIHQGIETAIRAVSIVKNTIPDIEFQIYGKGTDEQYFRKLTEQLNLGRNVFFNDIVPLDLLPYKILQADIGIEPKSKFSFGNEAFSTKILEFMMLGIPVIASDTFVHKYYFNEHQLRFFESDNPEDLARCILEIKDDLPLRKNLISNSSKYMKYNNWEKRKVMYTSLVDNMVNR